MVNADSWTTITTRFRDSASLLVPCAVYADCGGERAGGVEVGVCAGESSWSASCRRPSSFKGQDLYDVASLFLPPDVVLIISGTCPRVGGGWRGEILVSATAVSVSHPFQNIGEADICVKSCKRREGAGQLGAHKFATLMHGLDAIKKTQHVLARGAHRPLFSSSSTEGDEILNP
ncbi:hypothetical protein B0H14DRAFT_2649258 [Mycena olivaceomarginata]|nr:hypothetical protein B0H14DRAFT_2649258 [Mycena olivaceomarginata]